MGPILYQIGQYLATEWNNKHTQKAITGSCQLSRNQIVFIIFRLIWHQMEFHLISGRFLCVKLYSLHKPHIAYATHRLLRSETCLFSVRLLECPSSRNLGDDADV